MTRSRASARAAGSKAEKDVAECLAEQLDDDRIERRVRNGAKDRGDISGLRLRGERHVVEVKNCARMDLCGWWAEASIEAGNDDARFKTVVHKRKGKANPLDWYVTMTVREWLAQVWDVH